MNVGVGWTDVIPAVSNAKGIILRTVCHHRDLGAGASSSIVNAEIGVHDGVTLKVITARNISYSTHDMLYGMVIQPGHAVQGRGATANSWVEITYDELP